MDFLVVPWTSQWSHEQSGHGDRDDSYVWALKHGMPLTKTDLDTADAKSQICQQQRQPLSPRYGIIFQDDKPATWSHTTTLDHFLREEDNALPLLK